MELSIPSLDDVQSGTASSDNAPIAEMVATYLRHNGYQVEAVRITSVVQPANAQSPADEDVARILCAGELTVDTLAHEVRLRGELIALTVKEFDLLVHFMGHPRRACRRDELMRDVWGYRYGDASTVTVHVRRLREKIETDPAEPRYIRTVWGIGYRFEP